MKNIYEVIKQKEAQVLQLQKEIEALQIAAALLADEADTVTPLKPVPMSVPGTPLAAMSRAGMSKENGHGGPTWDAVNKQFP
jgi:hypothetical protein